MQENRFFSFSSLHKDYSMGEPLYTPETERHLLLYLERLDITRASPAVRKAIMRRIKTVHVEAVVFQGGQSNMHVLLLNAAQANEPELWQLPERIILADETPKDAVNALLTDLGIFDTVTPAQACNAADVSRGEAPDAPSVALPYVCFAAGKYDGPGKYWPVSALPNGMRSDQVHRIKGIVEDMSV